MVVKVLVVDDSSFFRRRVTEILEQDRSINVVDTACNGREAIDKVKKLKPDVITMDIEMPIMDGISAVREIMAHYPTPTLMFSSLTQEGAKATLDALDAGAVDFLPKRFEDIAKDRQQAISQLQQRVKAISRQRVTRISAVKPAASSAVSRVAKVPVGQVKAVTPVAAKNTGTETASVTQKKYTKSGKHHQIVAIGTSTGGPVALQAVLTQLPASFPYPILLIQHMPGTFTSAFAGRLNSLCKISVKEACSGDVLRPGYAYLAPGGKQMIVEGKANNARLKVIETNDPKINYKPCVDITFGSLAKVFRDKVLAVVLTGMGADGRDGARMLKEHGSTIWAQDEASCVVYGMPQAVERAGLISQQFPLEMMSSNILIEVS